MHAQYRHQGDREGRPYNIRGLGRCSSVCGFSGVAHRVGWKVLCAIFAQPEVGGEREDDQAKARHEDLLSYGAGYDGLRIAVDDGDFEDFEADHDKAHGG